VQSFTDRHNRKWLIEINVALAKKVRALTGVDLYRLVENEFAKLQELLRDPITLVDVIYVLCKEQADAAKLTDEQFGAGLAGQTVVAAADAFFEAFVSFSQDQRTAAVLRSMKAKGEAAVSILLTEAEQKLEQTTPESMVQELKEKSGSLPEQSESTPARLPFAS